MLDWAGEYNHYNWVFTEPGLHWNLVAERIIIRYKHILSNMHFGILFQVYVRKVKGPYEIFPVYSCQDCPPLSAEESRNLVLFSPAG